MELDLPARFLRPYSHDHTCFLDGRHKLKEREVGRRSPTVELQGTLELLHIVKVKVGLHSHYKHYCRGMLQTADICAISSDSRFIHNHTHCQGSCKSTAFV